MKDNQFEHFSASSKQVLILAQRIAEELGSKISSTHLLLAIANSRSNIASQILNEFHISGDKIHLALSLSKLKRRKTSSGLTKTAANILSSALLLAKKRQESQVKPEYVLLALVKNKNCEANRILRELSIDVAELQTEIESALGIKSTGKPFKPSDFIDQSLKDMRRMLSSDSPNDFGDDFDDDFLYESSQETKLNQHSKAKSALSYFATDLTERVRSNELDPIIGRDSEVQRIIQILNRKTKNNPVLVGDPGVGKTAIVEGLAQRITKGEVPDELLNKKIMMLDLALIVSGTKYRGEFEERLKKVMDEIIKNKNIILFVDEVHSIVGVGSAEGAMDAANIIKPALSKGQLRLIGATTLDEYRKYIEKDAALERRFQMVKVSEPSEEDTIKILTGIRPSFEKHHRVKIADEAIIASVKLSKRYIQDRFLPDKAIDLIDEAASSKSLASRNSSSFSSKKLSLMLKQLRADKVKKVQKQQFEAAAILRDQEKKLIAKIKHSRETGQQKLVEPVVKSYDIATIVSSWTGIPLTNLISDEKKRFTNLEKVLAQKIMGQTEAVKAVSAAIMRGQTGISRSDRPLGSFIFLGPTGVGKTELAKVLAEKVFENKDALIKIDMSEFMERHNISRLIGAPPGYVGYEDAGKLTETVRRNPYSVVLLDEVEKAHPEVQNILLQILEDGHLTDAKGRRVNFKNTIIIMTSNIGMAQLKREAKLGFRATRDKKLDFLTSFEETKNEVIKKLRDFFRPEFLNRVDKIVVFKPLTKKIIEEIVKLQLSELAERLKDQKLTLKYDQNVISLIAKAGFDPENGARPIRRAILDLIEDPLAEAIIQRKYKSGQVVNLKADDRKKIVLF